VLADLRAFLAPNGVASNRYRHNHLNLKSELRRAMISLARRQETG
jgi:hypothetical protein